MAQSQSSKSSRREEPATAKTYRLACTDCEFETTVTGDAFDALDIADAHQEEYERPIGDHFVDFTIESR